MRFNTERLNSLLYLEDDLPTLIVQTDRYGKTGIWPTHNRDGSPRGSEAKAMKLHDHFSYGEMNELLAIAVERAYSRIDMMEDIDAETYLSAREIDKLGTVGHIVGLANLRALNNKNCLLKIGDPTPPALREGAIAHLTLCLLILADVICPLTT